MFTGLIEGVGRLDARDARGGDARLRIAAGTLPFDGVALGESIAVNGVCLTVVAFDGHGFEADASNETLALTTLGPAEAPLLATPVWDDPLRFVAAPDDPLARMRRVTLADLAAHPAVLPDADTFTHRIVAEAFAQRGLALQLRMTTNYMETIKMLASVGLAWSALPETMLDAQVQVLPVREAKLVRQLGSIVHGGPGAVNPPRGPHRASAFPRPGRK